MNNPVKLIRRSCLAALAASPLALAPAAFAEYQSDAAAAAERDYAAQAQQPAVNIDDATLDQFANAFLEVQTIQTSASQEMEQVTDQAQAQDIQQRAQDEMVQAVIDTGLSVEDYNQIAQQMNTDAELREDIMARLEEQRGS
ncbi:MAG: DUF4168 domain-containing protein [Gammaproteobacteria bacterium]|nr:DUF4168 domain-containing protein [Gammaproteobacteria bacterium]